MRCKPFQPRTRICQAAHYADDLVEDFFHFELTAGLRTQGTHKKGLSGLSSSFRTQEETITESVLVRLAAIFGDVIQVEIFTKKAETVGGADWFWILDFGQILVPMLVQAKRTKKPWDGDQDWTVDIDLAQKATIETTASNWNVGAQFCVYAPSWDERRHCFARFRHSFMHLLPTIDVTANSFESHDWNVVQHMTPFTCFCCCATDPNDAEDGLNISREKFKERGELESLLAHARENESIKGTAMFKMGGERSD